MTYFPSFWRAFFKSASNCAGSTGARAAATASAATPPAFAGTETAGANPLATSITAPAKSKKPPLTIMLTAMSIEWMFATRWLPKPVSTLDPNINIAQPKIAIISPAIANGDLGIAFPPLRNTQPYREGFRLQSKHIHNPVDTVQVAA